MIFRKESGQYRWIDNISSSIKQTAGIRRTTQICPRATRFAGRSMKPEQTLGFQDISRFLTDLFDGDLHAKRVLSHPTLLTINVVRTIPTGGQLYRTRFGAGTAAGDEACHQASGPAAFQRGDRHRCRAPPLGPSRGGIAHRHQSGDGLDDFDADGQTIMLSLLSRHGRATPLMWLTVETATLKNHRNEYEYQGVGALRSAGA